jgi:hypothetical protein
MQQHPLTCRAAAPGLMPVVRSAVRPRSRGPRRAMPLRRTDAGGRSAARPSMPPGRRTAPASSPARRSTARCSTSSRSMPPTCPSTRTPRTDAGGAFGREALDRRRSGEPARHVEGRRFAATRPRLFRQMFAPNQDLIARLVRSGLPALALRPHCVPLSPGWASVPAPST